MTPERRRARAYAAQALLADDTIQQGWDELENDIISEWAGCSRWAKSKRERLFVELRTIKALRHKLANYAGHAPRD